MNILLSLIIVAVTARVIFWLYTGRIWEDALISLTPARNVWDCIGLTHHVSELRVHSFTSALGKLILIAGEAFHQGLLAMRLASIVASIAALYFAYRLGVLLSYHWFAHVLGLELINFSALTIRS